MQSLVVYDSKFGNTKTIAETVAEALGTVSHVRVAGLDSVIPQDVGQVDLLVVGGPTQNHGLSRAMREFLNSFEAANSGEMVACVFDTRYRMPAMLSGSAGKEIQKQLRRAGIPLFWPVESFFVSRDSEPVLEPNELERARSWGKELIARLEFIGWCAA